jgi:hypothetical protein
MKDAAQIGDIAFQYDLRSCEKASERANETAPSGLCTTNAVGIWSVTGWDNLVE